MYQPSVQVITLHAWSHLILIIHVVGFTPFQKVQKPADIGKLMVSWLVNKEHLKKN